MPRSGGTYTQVTPVASGPTVWADTKAAGDTNITTADHDYHDQDIAAALTASIANDGQTPILANLPMSTFRHTGVGNGVARTDYAALGQLQDGEINWVVAGGTADAITATYSPAITALTDGQLCGFRAGSSNATTTPNFAPNGLTAHTITTGGGAAVSASAWNQNQEVLVRYNLANTRWEMVTAPTVFARSGATVTSPMSSNLVLTSSSKQVQSVAPNAAGLAIQLPDATTLTSVAATLFEFNNLISSGLFPVQVIDSASTVIGWVLPGARMLVHLDSIAAATGNWRLQTGDVVADATGTYLTNSQSAATSSTVTAGIQSLCQLSATNGIWAGVSTTTLSLYGWSEGEKGKLWGAQTTIAITSGKWATLVPLTSTTALIVYLDGTPNMQSAVVTLNTGTLATTVGTPSQITSDTMGGTKFMHVLPLSSTLVLVGYVTSSGAVKAGTVSVSGTTATANTVAASSVTTTGGTTGIVSVKLSATVAHVFFADTSNGISVMRVNISGGTTTNWASPVVVKSDTSFNDFCACDVDGTHAAVLYGKFNTFAGAVNGAIVTDGSPVTIGTEATNIVQGRQFYAMVQGDPTQLVQYGTKAYAIVATQTAAGTLVLPALARLSLSTTTISLDEIRPLFSPSPTINNIPAEISPFGGIFQIPWLDSAGHLPIPQTVLGVAA